jgi:formamidopyrimidine-DNA glycosylase
MPERPDLEYVVPILDRTLRGQRITAVKVQKPVVLRQAVEGALEALLVGQAFQGARRQLHFVVLALDGGAPALDLVVHPMLAGRFMVCDPTDRVPADTAMTWDLSGGQQLRYRDSEQMGKVYVVAKGNHGVIPGFSPVGLDVLDPRVFTLEAFRAQCKKRKDQLKVFLMDKAALDSLGNAYADEVCFAAGMHPKTRVRELNDDDVAHLHASLVKVLTNATAEVARRKPPLEEKVRDFLSVRNHAGDACPRCGGKIRRTGVHGHDAFFCPTCQPETRQHAVVDWRKAVKPGAPRTK